MRLQFAVESIGACWDDFLELASSHWNETMLYRRGQRLNPDKERYLQYEAGGWFVFFTARHLGRLVGHAGMYLMPSMHTQHMTACEDYWFLLPEFRKGRNAIELYKFVENECSKRGVTEIEMTTGLTNRAGRILDYMGYECVSMHYWKSLEKSYVQAESTTAA